MSKEILKDSKYIGGGVWIRRTGPGIYVVFLLDNQKPVNEIYIDLIMFNEVKGFIEEQEMVYNRKD
jgi:hypothetical protein